MLGLAMGEYPQPTSAAVTAVMKGNRRRDTKPEIRLRRILHGRGHRFRVDRPIRLADRNVRPDIVFGPARVAVFVDGCFWHGCPEHGNTPRTNTNYWPPKLQRNKERDRTTTAELRAAGWLVLRVWEHEDPEVAARLISESVRARRSAKGGPREI
jgi:DNA mismatch endonuclease (patch repair protein)